MVSEEPPINTFSFISKIEERLREAHVLASTTQDLATKGLRQRATEVLLDVEPLIFEAKILLNAASIFVRSEHEHR